MSILVISRNFPPLQGGMERLIHHVALSLSAEYEVLLCGPVGASAFLPEAFQVREVAHRPLWKFLPHSFLTAIQLAWRYRPDAIVGGSGLVGPTTKITSMLVRRPAIVYLHGLDIVVDHPLYRLLFLPFIRRCDCLLVNSNATRQLAINAGIPPNRLTILHPGTALPAETTENQQSIDFAAFRTRFKLGNSKILLSVGRLTQRKGLCEFIEHCMPEIIKAHPDCQLVVIGDTPKNALLKDDSSQRERSEQACQRLGLTENVQFLGEVDDATLNTAYQIAEALVFPVIERAGDIEGFGMVAIEAAAHGTPTIAFAVGGVPDAVSSGVSGELLTPGDYSGMQNALMHILDRSHTYPECRTFAAKFAWPVFGEKLRSIVRRMTLNK